jgi:deoxyadenosine/deoxycytidine kinase
VPPLPTKAPKPNPKYIKKRERYYQRFLAAVSRCEEFKASQFLLDFLFDQDLKNFQKAQKDADKAKYPRQIEEYITFKG